MSPDIYIFLISRNILQMGAISRFVLLVIFCLDLVTNTLILVHTQLKQINNLNILRVTIESTIL
jgi:hypothetical protein